MTSSTDTEVDTRPRGLAPRAFRSEDMRRRELDELRSYARAALGGLLTRQLLPTPEEAATRAWKIADAMLVERKQRGGD